MDAREIEIVHSIMELWTRGKSYSAIAAHLNGLGLRNRRATPWEHSLVRSIVERNVGVVLVVGFRPLSRLTTQA